MGAWSVLSERQSFSRKHNLQKKGKKKKEKLYTNSKGSSLNSLANDVKQTDGTQECGWLKKPSSKHSSSCSMQCNTSLNCGDPIYLLNFWIKLQKLSNNIRYTWLTAHSLKTKTTRHLSLKNRKDTKSGTSLRCKKDHVILRHLCISLKIS